MRRPEPAGRFGRLRLLSLITRQTAEALTLSIGAPLSDNLKSACAARDDLGSGTARNTRFAP